MVGHFNSLFSDIRHEFPLQLIWPLYFGDLCVCFFFKTV